MMTLEEVIQRLAPMNLAKVAKETNLPYVTVWKISSSRHKNVPYSAVKAISDYLESL
jgi:hypothetical protein